MTDKEIEAIYTIFEEGYREGYREAIIRMGYKIMGYKIDRSDIYQPCGPDREFMYRTLTACFKGEELNYAKDYKQIVERISKAFS